MSYWGNAAIAFAATLAGGLVVLLLIGKTSDFGWAVYIASCAAIVSLMRHWVRLKRHSDARSDHMTGNIGNV